MHSIDHLNIQSTCQMHSFEANLIQAINFSIQTVCEMSNCIFQFFSVWSFRSMKWHFTSRSFFWNARLPSLFNTSSSCFLLHCSSILVFWKKKIYFIHRLFPLQRTINQNQILFYIYLPVKSYILQNFCKLSYCSN